MEKHFYGKKNNEGGGQILRQVLGQARSHHTRSTPSSACSPGRTQTPWPASATGQSAGAMRLFGALALPSHAAGMAPRTDCAAGSSVSHND